MKKAIWILAEQNGGVVSPVSFELLARGRKLADASGGELCAVLLAPPLPAGTILPLYRHGADRVIVAEHETFDRPLPEPAVRILTRLATEGRPAIFIAAATTFGRTIFPALAIRLSTGLTADCTELSIEPDTGLLLQVRPAIGGNILATIKTPQHTPQMATVRPHSHPPLRPDPARSGTPERVAVRPDELGSRITRIAFIPAAAGETPLQDADMVVAGGRGLKKKEQFSALIPALAEELGAAVGASRDAVDLGWAPYPAQVGLSGRTVMPKLYVAVGISGSIQHLAGMRTSEKILAINSDPEAQIFSVADLGIVGNLFDIVPRLTARLRQRRKEADR